MLRERAEVSLELRCVFEGDVAKGKVNARRSAPSSASRSISIYIPDELSCQLCRSGLCHTPDDSERILKL